MKNNTTVHIAYADDHKVVRKGLVFFLNSMWGIQVDIEADNGKDLITQLQNAGRLPDICLLDINMPEMNGFETIIKIKENWPQMKVLVLTVFDNEAYIIRMISYGANGYLLKSCDPEEIKAAILSIHNDGMYYSGNFTRQFVGDIKSKKVKPPKFTEGEALVLKYSCTDLSYSEIAGKLGTTTRSVEGYRDSLFKKLNVHNRVGLAMFAVQFGFAPIETYLTEDKNFLTTKIQ